MFSQKHRAFTAIETLLAIGIIAATAGVSVPMYRNYQISSDLDTVTEQTIQGLRRAQLLAQSGEQDLPWGFYVQDGVLFAGQAYAVRNQEFDEVYPVPDTVNTSGLKQVVFSRVEGVPDRTGDIIIQGLNGEQRIIQVGTYGVVETTAEDPVVEGSGSSAESGSDSDSDADSDSDSSTDSDSSNSSDSSTDSSTDSNSSSSDGTDDTSDGTSGDDDTATCEDRFAINADGTIETTGTVTATFDVLGSAITYGAGGPSVDVTMEASVNGGETWFDLFNGDPVQGGEVESVSNLVSGSKILLRAKGRYSWFFRETFRSNDGSGHIKVLKNNDSVPSHPVFDDQDDLADFLQPIIEDERVTLEPYNAVYLVELGDLGTTAADFQDAVIKVTFVQEGVCSTENLPRFKVNFPRVENEGDGDAQNRVLVGEQGVPYAEGQWVALEDENGNVLLDNFLSEDVDGVAAWRHDGYVRFLQHGSHGLSGKEIVDATITFDNVTVNDVVNDSEQNATESMNDGVVNDGSDGDEVTLQDDQQTVTFQSRVQAADDAILVYWQSGNPPGSDDDSTTDSSSSSSDDGSSDSSSSDSNSSDDDGGGELSNEPPDPCAVAYTKKDGVLHLNEPADVTFRVLGSHAYYGSRGPEISTYVHASFNGGSSYQTLFENRDVDGGEQQTFADVSSGARLVVKGDGRYSWQFRNSAESNDTTRVQLLERGDALPGTTPYQNINSLQPFVQNIIDSSNHIDIGQTSVVYLIELEQLNSDSDYQDIVIEVFLEKPASGGICGGEYVSSSSSSADSTDDSDDSSSDSSSSTDEEQVTICHFPPGNKKNPETITVGKSAVPAHKRHGDREGSCDSDADGDTILNSSDLCPNTYMPESVPRTGTMLFRRYALTDDSPVFRTGPRKQFVGDYSLTETRGCSCEQLVDVAERKNDYHFAQFPRLHRNIKSLFPFYTIGARSYGCGEAILRMVTRFES